VEKNCLKNKEEFKNFEDEKKEVFLEKNIYKLISLEKEDISKIIKFLFQSVYTHNLLIDFEIERVKKEKILALSRIIEYFLDFKAKWPATITSAECVVRYAKSFCAPDRETFVAIYLDSHHTVLSSSIISYGTTDFAYVNVKMIFSYALKFDATKIILIHNHPSGDPTPSKEDIAFTDKVNSLAKDFNITLLDHIIIANTYFSFKSEGFL